MSRKYKRVFTVEAMIVCFFCSLIIGNAVGVLMYMITDSYWFAFGTGVFAAYAVIDVLMRSPNE